MRLKNIVFFTIFLIFQNVEIVENKRTLKLTNFKCSVWRKDLMQFKVCNIKAISRDISELNVEVFLPQKPVRQVKIFFGLTRLENLSRFTLVNISLDVCEFMKDRERYPLANVFYHVLGMDRYSNMNHTCPYNEDVYVRGYRADDVILSKVPFPLGEYTLTIVWFLKKQKAGKTEIFFKYYEQIVYEKRKKDNGTRGF